jgi:ankyrin repeat protein
MDIAFDSETLLLIAMEAGPTEIVELLLQHGANPNDGKFMPPLGRAASRGDNHHTKLLIQSGADVNQMGMGKITPLASAVINRIMERSPIQPSQHKQEGLKSETEFVAVIQLLLDSGADPNHQIYRFMPLLYYMVYLSPSFNVTVIKMLLEHGADVNSKTSDGDTPLHALMHSCTKLPDTSVIQLFLQHGANVNAQNHRGWTPLHSAAFYDAVDSKSLAKACAGIKLLLIHGADLQLRDCYLSIPFHNLQKKYSLHDMMERYDVIKLLLEAGPQFCKDCGANIISDFLDWEAKGQTWFRKRVIQAIELLIKHGAQADERAAKFYT